MSSRCGRSTRLARYQNSFDALLDCQPHSLHSNEGGCLLPLLARKAAREPPAGPDPTTTQSVVKSGSLEVPVRTEFELAISVIIDKSERIR
jgi:hypothetical protein